MSFLQIALLALVQGAAELLPVSSSAHVIVAEKLMHIDPTSPEATFLLVMLHTGTMLAVILYFWKQWQTTRFTSRQVAWNYLRLLAMSTILTAVVGYGIKMVIEKTLLRGYPKADIETIFGNLALMSAALATAGVLILVAGLLRGGRAAAPDDHDVTPSDALWIGAVQGLCLPFRGFSRSGATISTAMLRQVSRIRAEDFSFALAVILTPPVLVREFHRLHEARAAVANAPALSTLVLPGCVGLVCSFIAGLLALKWLSKWLETGHWYRFGVYCLIAASVVLWLHLRGL